MTDEPLDSAWAVLKRDEPFDPQRRQPPRPVSPEELRRLQLQALRRMQASAEEKKQAEIEAANAEAHKRLQARQAPKISNYMADSAQSMAQNNPTGNLAHPSGRLPGVPLPDIEPLDLSMESLRGGTKGMPPMKGQTANLNGTPVMAPPIQAHLERARLFSPYPPKATLPQQTTPTNNPYTLLPPMVGVLQQTRQGERLPQTVDSSTMFDE